MSCVPVHRALPYVGARALSGQDTAKTLDDTIPLLNETGHDQTLCHSERSGQLCARMVTQAWIRGKTEAGHPRLSRKPPLLKSGLYKNDAV